MGLVGKRKKKINLHFTNWKSLEIGIYLYLYLYLLLEAFFLERSTKEGFFLMTKGLKWPDACYLPSSLGFEKKAVNLSPFKRC